MTKRAAVAAAVLDRRAATRNDLPLVLDLDGTVVRTDTLMEGLLNLLFCKPLAMFSAVAGLLKGRAAFKREVVRRADLHPDSLPYNGEILALATAWRATGGQVHLVSAADQAVADAVADHLGGFDSAMGSDGVHNLKGRAKAEALERRFPQGFAYAGDSAADLAVWAKASEIIVVGGARRLRSMRRRGLKPDREIRVAPVTFKDWVRTLRLHQWSKNGLLFVPLALSHEWNNPYVLLTVALGFVAFGLVASGSYLLNDLSDLHADRQHPKKRARAFASGRISLAHGAILAAGLIVLGVLGAATLTLEFLFTVLGYLALTLAYSFKLKRQPLIDVITIGGLFMLRIIAGTLLVDSWISLWLSSFTLTLFTSLALAKRHAELVRAAAVGREVAGRGYLLTDTALTVSTGQATAVSSIMVMLLYMKLEAGQTGLYDNISPLLLIPLVLASWLARVWLRAHRGELDEDPVIFALKDRVSWAHGLVVGALWLVSVAPSTLQP